MKTDFVMDPLEAEQCSPSSNEKACPHPTLYARDMFNQPQPWGSCLLCERDSWIGEAGRLQNELCAEQGRYDDLRERHARCSDEPAARTYADTEGTYAAPSPFEAKMDTSDSSPVTQQEIVSAIFHHARELTRLTETWPAPPPTASIETAVRGWIERRRKELSKSGITGGHYVADLCLLEEVLDDCLRGAAETANLGVLPTCPNCGHEPCAPWCSAGEKPVSQCQWEGCPDTRTIGGRYCIGHETQATRCPVIDAPHVVVDGICTHCRMPVETSAAPDFCNCHCGKCCNKQPGVGKVCKHLHHHQASLSERASHD